MLTLVPLLLVTPQAAAELPTYNAGRAVVRQAQRAVAQGSVRTLESQWRTALRANPADRAARLGLSTLARLTYNYESADTLAFELHQPPRNHDSYSVYSALGAGIALREQGIAEGAVSHLLAAMRDATALGDSSAVVWSALEAAQASRMLGRHASADSLERRARVFRPRNDAETNAFADCFALSARWTSADASVTRQAGLAAQLADAAGAPRVATWCRGIAASARSNSGDMEAVRVDFRRAAATADSLGDLFRSAELHAARGANLIAAGALGEALVDLRLAIASALRVRNASQEGWAQGNAAQAYYVLGDPVSAAHHAERAIVLLEGQRNLNDRAMAASLRGDLAAGRQDLKVADTWYDSAARIFRASRYRGGEAHVSEIRAFVAMRLAEFDRAATLLDRAWTDAGDGAATSRPLLDYLQGTVALKRGRMKDAARFYARAERGVAGQADLQYYLDARRAELQLIGGDTAAAERGLMRAFNAFEASRAALSERDLRATAFQTSVDEADPDLGVATILAALTASGRTESAFALAEQRRGRHLLDELLRARALGESVARDGSAPNWRPAHATTVRGALPDSVALVEYVTGVGGEVTTVFVLTPDTLIAVSTTPVDSLAPHIGRFRLVLESNGNADAIGTLLGNALLGGVLPLLAPSITHLVFVPDGALHSVPFDVLRQPNGTYLFERFSVSVAASASVAVELMQRHRRADAPAVLAFGDAVFPVPGTGPETEADVYQAAFAAYGGLPRLREAGREARLVAGFGADSRVLERREASESALKREPLHRYRIIHLATHAVVDEGAATRTALALSPGQGEDGFVSLSELSELSLSADLVVLSACRTATGRLLRGEGIQGLSTQLIASGARSVLATNWPIGDRATVDFVERFYSELAHGKTVGAALQATRVAMQRAGAPVAQWAAFSLIGDPTTSIPLNLPQPARGWRVAFALAAGCGALLLIFVLMRRVKHPT